MTDIVLITASGLARETASSIAATGIHKVVGILDDNPRLHGTTSAGVPVLGDIDYATELGTQFLVCAGQSRVRSFIVERLRRLGIGPERFATHVDASTSVGDRVRIGKGTIILAGCALTCDITVGNHVVLMPRVVLTHDDVVADYVTIAAGAVVGGRTVLGRASYIGMNASIRQDINVGAGSTLGMGAVLVRDLPNEQTWVGNPAIPLTAQGTRTRRDDRDRTGRTGRIERRVPSLTTRYSQIQDSPDLYSTARTDSRAVHERAMS